MKSLGFLSILVLCAACVPQGLSTVVSSSILIATQSSLSTAEPASTSGPAPTVTPAPLPPSIFDVVIENLAFGQQGHLYASGYGNGFQQLPHPQFAQWDGEKWIALDTGFQPENHALVVDSVGHLYVEVLTDSQQGLSNAFMKWDGARWEDVTGNLNTVVDALKPGRLSSNIPVQALAVDGEDNLYAAGAFFYPSADYTAEFPIGYVAKWDQDTWTVLDKGFDKVNIFTLAVSATGKVYVSGEQPVTPERNYSYIAQWDGEKWAQINANMPANLLQAQRDYFGAHTYRRIDKPRGEYFHTNWTGHGGDVTSTVWKQD